MYILFVRQLLLSFFVFFLIHHNEQKILLLFFSASSIPYTVAYDMAVVDDDFAMKKVATQNYCSFQLFFCFFLHFTFATLTFPTCRHLLLLGWNIGADCTEKKLELLIYMAKQLKWVSKKVSKPSWRDWNWFAKRDVERKRKKDKNKWYFLQLIHNHICICISVYLYAHTHNMLYG